jgi:hypothetical protein
MKLTILRIEVHCNGVIFTPNPLTEFWAETGEQGLRRESREAAPAGAANTDGRLTTVTYLGGDHG